MARRAETSPEARPATALPLQAFAAAVLGLLCAGPALALYPKKGDASPHAGVRDARQRSIQGIDISRWQGEIDWAKVKDAGTRFAFIKATEGGDHLDPMFKKNWAEAKKAGVPRSAYHFVYWCRPAKDQVRWFKRHIPRDPDALPPVLDVEWNGESEKCGKKIPREKALAKIREMLKGLQEHTGKKPIIYTDITFHEDVLEGEFNDHPYWLRSTAAPLKHRYERKQWEFWQFTTTGRVPGISGDVDRNAFFGTEHEFSAWRDGRYDIGARKWRGGESKVATTPKPPATPAGLRTPKAAGNTPLKFAPPGKIPRSAQARDVATTGSIARD
ncbi:glycoside hydrolase [Bosea sp. Root483D1]|uniref:glycoside hydrolase family 25 protein n=1 Tax=Bosea sp. Root483D1 TaxID=1736544 RepID=UPI00070F07B5|nr:GH25 family lysozyme [Bosea sp. Root483D1]KRE13255.1 glycoside hydrolase [Bosea sp. Root483D1]